MNLLPEYHAQPYGRKFKAAFKLFEGTDWHVVPNSEPFDTASEAIEAAKEHVKVRAQFEDTSVEGRAGLGRQSRYRGMAPQQGAGRSTSP